MPPACSSYAICTGSTNGCSLRTTRPAESSTVVATRPAAEVRVQVRVAASYAATDTLPLSVCISVSDCSVLGSLGSASSALRAIDRVEVSPPGVTVVDSETYSAAIPKRGSGAVRAVMVLPSGSHVTDVPSVLLSALAFSPPGKVFSMAPTPADVVPDSYLVVSPSAVVFVVTVLPPVVCPSSSSHPPAGSSARASLPQASNW